MLVEEALRIFDVMGSHNNGAKNAHFKEIKQVLLENFFPIKSLFEKKHAMCHAMKKSCGILKNIFQATNITQQL